MSFTIPIVVEPWELSTDTKSKGMTLYRPLLQIKMYPMYLKIFLKW